MTHEPSCRSCKFTQVSELRAPHWRKTYSSPASACPLPLSCCVPVPVSLSQVAASQGVCGCGLGLKEACRGHTRADSYLYKQGQSSCSISMAAPNLTKLQWAPGPSHAADGRCCTGEGLLPYLIMTSHLGLFDSHPAGTSSCCGENNHSHSFVRGEVLSRPGRSPRCQEISAHRKQARPCLFGVSESSGLEKQTQLQTVPSTKKKRMREGDNQLKARRSGRPRSQVRCWIYLACPFSLFRPGTFPQSFL